MLFLITSFIIAALLIGLIVLQPSTGGLDRIKLIGSVSKTNVMVKNATLVLGVSLATLCLVSSIFI